MDVSLSFPLSKEKLERFERENLKRFSIRFEENRKFFFSHRLRATQRFVKYRIWIIVNRSVVKSDREEKFICQKSWKGKCQGWKWKFLDNKTKYLFRIDRNTYWTKWKRREKLVEKEKRDRKSLKFDPQHSLSYFRKSKSIDCQTRYNMMRTLILIFWIGKLR